MEKIGTFSVCGLVHTIYLVPDVQEAMVQNYKEYVDCRLEGVYLPEHKVILLRDDMAPTLLKEVLYHEIGHAIHVTHQVELNEQQNQALALGVLEVTNTLEFSNESDKSTNRKRNEKSPSKPRSRPRPRPRKHR